MSGPVGAPSWLSHEQSALHCFPFPPPCSPEEEVESQGLSQTTPQMARKDGMDQAQVPQLLGPSGHTGSWLSDDHTSSATPRSQDAPISATKLCLVSIVFLSLSVSCKTCKMRGWHSRAPHMTCSDGAQRRLGRSAVWLVAEVPTTLRRSYYRLWTAPGQQLLPLKGTNLRAREGFCCRTLGSGPGKLPSMNAAGRWGDGSGNQESDAGRAPLIGLPAHYRPPRAFAHTKL